MSNVSSIKNIPIENYSSIFDFLYKNVITNPPDVNVSLSGVEIVDVDGNIQKPRSPAEFFNMIANDTASKIVSGLKTVDCEYEWYQDFVSFLDKSALPLYEATSKNFFDGVEKVGATVTVGVQSLGEGILNVGEGIVDVFILAGSAIGTIGTGLADLWQIVNGNEAKYTSELWDSTMSTVSIDAVGDAFDSLYEDTEYGRNLQEKSYFFNTVRTVGTGIGEVAGIVGLSLATFGLGSLASSGTISVSLGQTSTIASIVGLGQGTEEAWADGASLLEGLLAGGANSFWEGIQYFVGGKIGTTTFFGNNGIISSITKNGFGTKVLDSLTRIFLDGFDGGAEGIVQPLIAAIYKDGYYDEEGNYVEFTQSDNFFKKYGEIFSDYGGVQNIFTNALIGSGSSLLGEIFDIKRFFDFSDKNVLSLQEEILDNIDDNLDPIARARQAYIELNKRLHYDMNYYKADNKTKKEIYNQILSLADLDSNNVICKGWSELYRDLLIECGFAPDKVRIVGRNKDFVHKWVEIELDDGSLIVADATEAITGPPDISKVKYGDIMTGFFRVTKNSAGIRLRDVSADLIKEYSQYWRNIDKALGYTNESGYYFSELIENADSLFSNSDLYNNLLQNDQFNKICDTILNLDVIEGMDGTEAYYYFKQIVNNIFSEDYGSNVRIYANKLENIYESLFTIELPDIDFYGLYSSSIGKKIFKTYEAFNKFIENLDLSRF